MYKRQRWSSYPTPFAAPETTLEIEPPPGVVITPPAQVPLPDPVELDDRFVPRVGIEKTFDVARSLELVARLGYAYQAAVVPVEQPETTLVDFHRHVVALGAGGAFRRPFSPFSELRLDLHASLSQGVSREMASGSVGGRQFAAGATLGLAFDALGRSPAEYVY